MTRRAHILTTVLVVVLTACGVPADSKPRSISADQIPFDLLTPSTTETATTLMRATSPVQVYLVRGDRLATVSRSVVSPPTLGTVLATLIQGPTDDEEGAGLRSAINPEMRVLGTQTNGSTAVINVSDVFSDLSVQEQVDAVAQVVYTATALAGVDSVQITLNSRPVEVPRGDASTTKDPVKRSDFTALAPIASG